MTTNNTNHQQQKGKEETQREKLINNCWIEPNTQEAKMEVLKYYNSAQNFFDLSGNSHPLAFLVMIASFMSLISNAIYIVSYLQKESHYSQFARGCDIIAFTIYTLELIIKLVSEQGYYFFAWKNIFNLLLLISFIVPFCITNSMFELAYLSFFRIFQVTTFFSQVPYLSQIEIAHRMILRNLLSTIIMLLLLIIAIFLFSLIAYFCFTSNPDSPLKSLEQSVYFLTIEATGGGWTEFQEELDQVFNGAKIFSILFIVFTYVIIVRGFVAFLADNSIVENRLYLKRQEDQRLMIEQAEKEIRPTEKTIIIPLDITKSESDDDNSIIAFSIHKGEMISINKMQNNDIKKQDACKDLQNEVFKFNFWQLYSVHIGYEPDITNDEPRIYFGQVIVSFKKDKVTLSNYQLGYSQIKFMKDEFEKYEKIRAQSRQNLAINPSDHKQSGKIDDIPQIINTLNEILNNEKKNKSKYYPNDDQVFCYDFMLSNNENFTIKNSNKPIIRQKTEFQASSTDNPFKVYIRYVREINYNMRKIVLPLPSELGKVIVTLNINLLGKKRASEITENEESGFNQISSNDLKITEEKMLMKSGFWVSSLTTVLKDYALHNRMINICYHKIFQRTIMMCDYMPMTPDLVKQENARNIDDDSDDEFLAFKKKKIKS